MNMNARRMAKPPTILITGTSSGLGRAAAIDLLAAGCRVIAHTRTAGFNPVRHAAIHVTGDLSDADAVRALARQVNAIGRMDAVIHNAGTAHGEEVRAVNVIAPYLLCCLLKRPARAIFISSAMHHRGDPECLERFPDGCDYADSKLLLTTLMATCARLWPDTVCSAVDPGWVPTRMGGTIAPDDLHLGHQTQTWLATTQDQAAQQSGAYWRHMQRQPSHPLTNDPHFQTRLLDILAAHTGTDLRHTSQP